jgi:hypothetical protein
MKTCALIADLMSDITEDLRRSSARDQMVGTRPYRTFGGRNSARKHACPANVYRAVSAARFVHSITDRIFANRSMICIILACYVIRYGIADY